MESPHIGLAIWQLFLFLLTRHFLYSVRLYLLADKKNYHLEMHQTRRHLGVWYCHYANRIGRVSRVCFCIGE